MTDMCLNTQTSPDVDRPHLRTSHRAVLSREDCLPMRSETCLFLVLASAACADTNHVYVSGVVPERGRPAFARIVPYAALPLAFDDVAPPFDHPAQVDVEAVAAALTDSAPAAVADAAYPIAGALMRAQSTQVVSFDLGYPPCPAFLAVQEDELVFVVDECVETVILDIAAIFRRPGQGASAPARRAEYRHNLRVAGRYPIDGTARPKGSPGAIGFRLVVVYADACDDCEGILAKVAGLGKRTRVPVTVHFAGSDASTLRAILNHIDEDDVVADSGGEASARLLAASRQALGGTAPDYPPSPFVALKKGEAVRLAGYGARLSERQDLVGRMERLIGGGPECRLNSDCPEDEICSRANCRPACREDRDCAADERCLQRNGKPPQCGREGT